MIKRAGLALMLAIPVIAACGATKSQSGGTTVQPSPSPKNSVTSVDVNKSYWYAGFKTTITNAQVVKPPKPSPGFSPPRSYLLINAQFQNLGPDNYDPVYNHEWAVQSGTYSYLEHDGTDEKIPTVPGMQTTSGTIAVYIDDKFNLDKATLLVGNAGFNQPVIPLGKHGETYRSLEPQKVAATGTVTIPNGFTLAVSGGDLGYDDARNHQEQKTGEVQLILHYAITGNKDGICCFGQDNSILKLPDGTASAATRASGYAIPNNGITTPDQSVEFVFKAADGQYDYIVKGKYGPNNTDEQADLPFSLTLGVSASGSGTPPAGGAFPSPSPVPEATPSGH